ncbi:MAG: hypothetical protein EB027_04280, partial [Actinobacteria bacterium]|nr:hypothetical protein [Actinomycetota bacterium]
MAVMWWWTVPIGATLTAWFIVLWRSRASVHRDPVITVQRLLNQSYAQTLIADREQHVFQL